MKQQEETHGLIPHIAVVLALYCLAVVLLSGDLGFEGDDWWIFSFPYWHGFPHSLLEYAKTSLRPVEGVYWITLFEIFGFNKPVFQLFSLLILAAAGVVMGSCLQRLFPAKPGLIVSATFLSFFIPTVSCLTYVVTTDNSRLSTLLFWLSVWTFQRWAVGSGARRNPALPVLLYILAFLTYECASLLIFAVPLLVLPVIPRLPDGRWNRMKIFDLVLAVCVAFGLAVGLRFSLLSGGAVGQAYLVPPFRLVAGYLGLLPFYLTEPFTRLPTDAVAWLAGTVIAASMTWIWFRSARGSKGDSAAAGPALVQTRLYGILLGAVILILGMAPYQMAGYGSIPPEIMETAQVKWGFIPHGYAAWYNFNWSSRIYSSATFGLAIILASMVSGWKTQALRWGTAMAAAICVGAMAAFHAGLLSDWKEAARMRNSIMRSLVIEAPDVIPGTNFVFLNLDCTFGRAVVFRNWGGLRELVRMVYHRRDVGASYLYPYEWKWPNERRHQAVVFPEGFVTRGLDMNKPQPARSLLILNRVGDKLVPLDGIRCDDGLVPTGICWNNAESIRSNPERIIAWSDIPGPDQRGARNASSSRLISSLALSRIDLRTEIANRWGIDLKTRVPLGVR